MARLPRLVIPGQPHHVTQRGSRRAQTFFTDNDFASCLDQKENSAAFKMIRQSETTGRPLGPETWIEQLEKLTARQLKPQKRGPKRKLREDD